MYIEGDRYILEQTIINESVSVLTCRCVSLETKDKKENLLFSREEKQLPNLTSSGSNIMSKKLTRVRNFCENRSKQLRK